MVDINILATSDLHGRFVPFDYAINAADDSGSLAQVASLAKFFKKVPNTILLDCGDIIQDNSSELFLNEDLHPMIAGMNEIGYDAITLGNHEFNYGMDVLKRIMKQSKAAVLGGNVYNPDGTGVAKPYTIIEKSGVKIGIIGMVTPNITRWDAANLKGYKVTNPVDETKRVIAEIKDKVDVIVAAEHMGESSEYGVKGSGVVDLANACPDIDVIVAAHEHKAVEGAYYNNVLTVENKSGGQTAAVIKIRLKKDDNGTYKVAERESQLVDLKKWEPDPSVVNALSKYDEIAKNNANVIIGKLAGGDLVPPDEIKGIAQVQLQETPMLHLINEVQTYYSGAQVSAAACFNLAANMKAGDIKRCDTALIYKFANTLYKLEMTGAQLKKYMEWSASYYNTYKDGDLTISFNPNIRAYNYDTFSGINYEVNVSKEPGNRIEHLTYKNGKPIKATDKITIAVNNYRANSHLLTYGAVFKEGEKLPKLLDKDIHGEIGGVRELIGDYIKNVKKGVIKPEVSGNWKIVGNNWNKEFHQNAVELVADGIITVPASEDGRDSNVRSITKADIEPYVRIDEPGKVTSVKVKSKKAKSAVVTFKSVKNAVRYEVSYSTDKNFKKGVKKVSTKKTTINISKLRSKKRYYVRVRAVKFNLDDSILYGSYSKVISVKVK
ncbi:MAG TPA: bifunctional metallophosphatase/5'-nucleotidase [Lachnospiraceae bacterium]|nr:bifunctional metallophosphatase/5'-nucleotidase [Lachnospiraceae bacterium]